MKLSSKISLAALGFAAILGLSSCEQKKTLKVFSWTYYTPTDVVKAFEQEFGCKVIVTEYDSNETMFNKLVNGGAKSFDIVVPSQDYVSIMMKRGMLQPLIQEKFTNRSKINPKILEKATYDSEMVYAVPYYFGAAGIGVNKKKMPAGDYERTWNIFADPRFKGHASMMDDYREVIGDALKYKGYSVSTTNEAEVTEAVDLIKNDWLPNTRKALEKISRAAIYGSATVTPKLCMEKFPKKSGKVRLISLFRNREALHISTAFAFSKIQRTQSLQPNSSISFIVPKIMQNSSISLISPVS